MKIAHPAIRQDLLSILRADQADARTAVKALRADPDSVDTRNLLEILYERADQRTRRVLAILDAIQGPTRSQIGLDGSQAISVIGLHSKLPAMKKILQAFQASADDANDDIHQEAIPSLVDRVRLIQDQPQLYGTQWMSDLQDRLFFPTVENFSTMNDRRHRFGMSDAVHAIDLADGIPTSPIQRKKVVAGDQRDPTSAEHEYNFSQALN